MLLCDEHDTPATHHLSWTDAPGTADEHGASLTACAQPGCLAARCQDVADMGGELGDVEHLAAALAVAA